MHEVKPLLYDCLCYKRDPHTALPKVVEPSYDKQKRKIIGEKLADSVREYLHDQWLIFRELQFNIQKVYNADAAQQKDIMTEFLFVSITHKFPTIINHEDVLNWIHEICTSVEYPLKWK